MNNNDHREQDHMDAMRYAWHEHIPPKEYAPDGKMPMGNAISPQDLLARPRFSLIGYFFKPRVVLLDPKEIVAENARMGDQWFDSLENQYEVIVDYKDEFSSMYVDEPGRTEWIRRRWIVQPYKLAPSRAQAAWSRIVWYLNFPAWIVRYIRSWIK